MIEQTVEIVRRSNRIYGAILVEPEAFGSLRGLSLRMTMSAAMLIWWCSGRASR